MTIRGRRNYSLTTPGFVVDQDSVSLNSGRQIDWVGVGAAFGTAGARRIPAGTIMSQRNGKIVPRTSRTALTVTVASGTATVTQTAHGYAVGDMVTVTGTDDPDLDGVVVEVLTVPDANTYTFATEADDQTDTAGFSAGAAVGILVTSAQEDSRSDALTGYGVYVGGVFYSNLLPDFDDTDWDTFLTELGDRFVFESYQDVR